jgi:hypothetical protein
MAQPDAALLQDLCSRFILNVPAEELRCVLGSTAGYQM